MHVCKCIRVMYICVYICVYACICVSIGICTYTHVNYKLYTLKVYANALSHEYLNIVDQLYTNDEFYC